MPGMPTGPQRVHAVLERAHDRDLAAVSRGNVVDTVLGGSVGAHVGRAQVSG